MANGIDRVKDRAALRVRKEPHWGKLLKHRYLGYRKMESGQCSWIARRQTGRKLTYEALGMETETFGYDEAKAAAERWFAAFDQAAIDKATYDATKPGDRVTVTHACKAYVELCKVLKPDNPGYAHDIEMRFKRTVYENPIGDMKLKDLTKSDIKAWLTGLKMAPATLERNYTPLRAALNSAVETELAKDVSPVAWSKIKLPKKPDHRRELYLDVTQRRALLAVTSGGLRDLLEAAMLTGCRAGELTAATRNQFDARTATLKVKGGKTGSRPVSLSGAAVKFFERLAKDKLPKANLITRDDGKPWAHSDWDKLVKDAAKRAGLPDETMLYTMRHSWITDAIMGGLSVLEVARITGTSLRMVDEHYGHLVGRVAIERLNKVAMV